MTVAMKTWMEVAVERGVNPGTDGSINGAEFAKVGISIINGCPGCGATVAPHSSVSMDNEHRDYMVCFDCAGYERPGI